MTALCQCVILPELLLNSKETLDIPMFITWAACSGCKILMKLKSKEHLQLCAGTKFESRSWIYLTGEGFWTTSRR